MLSFLLLSFLSVSLSVYLSSFFSCFVPFCSFFPLFLCFVLCMFLSLIVFLWKPCHSLKVVLREIQQAEGKEWCLWDSKKTRRSLYYAVPSQHLQSSVSRYLDGSRCTLLKNYVSVEDSVGVVSFLRVVKGKRVLSKKQR